jgi:hypothetical protein
VLHSGHCVLYTESSRRYVIGTTYAHSKTRDYFSAWTCRGARFYQDNEKVCF